MSFNNEENQFILNALDTHLRQNGIGAAKMALLVVSKLQQAMKIKADLDALQGDSPEGSSRDGKLEMEGG